MALRTVSRAPHDGVDGVDSVALLPLSLDLRVRRDGIDGAALPPLPLSSSELLLDVFVLKGVKRRLTRSSRVVFIVMTTSDGTDRDSAYSAVRCCEWQSSKTVRWVLNFEKVVL